MYNEDTEAFKYTMQGVLQNYYALYHDPDVKLRQKDFIVYVICDGYDKIPEGFKQYMTNIGIYDEKRLVDDGYMKKG